MASWSHSVSVVSLEDSLSGGKISYFHIFNTGRVGSNDKPVLLKSKVQEVLQLGCPIEFVQYTIRAYVEARREWRRRDNYDKALKSAIELSIAHLRQMHKTTRHEFKVVIFDNTMPKVRYGETLNEFVVCWQELVQNLKVIGSNTHFSWAMIPRNQECGISIQVGHYSADYRFSEVMETIVMPNTRVEKAELICGCSLPSKGGIFSSVGSNPNDPEIRNRD